MKASEITKGDLLYWQRHRFGTGVKVKVIDPSPVYGKRGRYDTSPVKGRGTGILVEAEEGKFPDYTERVKVQYAVQLRQLVGPYAATVKRLKVQAKAQEVADKAARREQERRSAAQARTVARLRGLGVTAYAGHVSWGDGNVTLSVTAMNAMLDALPEGWKMPEPEEDDS